MEKFRTAVIGASGIVGQAFLHMLADHPLFEVVFISASDTKAGNNYHESVSWHLPFEMNEKIRSLYFSKMEITEIKKSGARFVFSALPGETAKDIETKLRSEGYFVFSNSSAMRYEKDVPILIPEANIDSINLIEKQGFPSKGFIVTNPNCCVSGLAVALAPLINLDIQELYISTYQSISGAGYPGIPSLDIMGNAIPYIKDEELKIGIEIQKILNIHPKIFPTCVRISTLFGHLETVWLKIGKTVKYEEIISMWNNYKLPEMHLPSCPSNPIIYSKEDSFPQPKFAFQGTPAGMTVFIGRLKQIENRIGFTLVVNNIIKGAAGGSIENAEAFISKYGEKI
jgi:aspartate-semialdehyde dehydrogenase